MWPARQGILLAFLGGLVADAGALFAAGGGAAPGALLGALGAFFLLVLVLQVFRPSDPDERFYALTVCASATVVTVLAGGFLAALGTAHGKDTVVVGALAAAFSAMFAALAARALPAKAAFAIGWVVALAAGIALASAAGLGAGPGSALGAVAGACGLLGRRVAAFDFPSRFVHRTAGVALPLACAGPLVLLLGVLG
jgi:multisubunit Na+/H+ antiporter MnhG subunit